MTDHVERWFRVHPGHHRTDQGGTRIICPNPDARGYPAVGLHERPTRTHRCPLCHQPLAHAELLPPRDGEQHEFSWGPAPPGTTT